MDYTFLVNLQTEFTLPEKGILSRVLHKDEHANVTLFGFSSGEALSAHSAPTPAILYCIEGEAEVQLGDDKVSAPRAPSSICLRCCLTASPPRQGFACCSFR